MKVIYHKYLPDDLKEYYKGAEFIEMYSTVHNDCDAVVSFHTLQQVSQTDVLPLLKTWNSYLKTGGRLTVLVPSLEWSARSIIVSSVNPLVIPSIYGMKGENRTGFTLPVLRRFFEMADFAVTIARSGEYTIDTPKGAYIAEQHLVEGVKIEAR